ncbi:MAG: LapA family protein [Thermodesulfobacteriota bacterium]|nr:LapA family protein [Thermodesulfobacteriota bacterium]
MKFVKILFALLGLAVIFKFSMDNPLPVDVTFHEYVTPKIPLFLLLITTFVLGMIAASLGSTLKMIQLKRQIKSLQPNGDVMLPKKKKKSKKKEQKKDEKDSNVNTLPVTEDVTEKEAVVADDPDPDADEIPDAIIEEPVITEEKKAVELETPEVIALPVEEVEAVEVPQENKKKEQ